MVKVKNPYMSSATWPWPKLAAADPARSTAAPAFRLSKVFCCAAQTQHRSPWPLLPLCAAHHSNLAMRAVSGGILLYHVGQTTPFVFETCFDTNIPETRAALVGCTARRAALVQALAGHNSQAIVTAADAYFPHVLALVRAPSGWSRPRVAQSVKPGAMADTGSPCF